MTDTLIVHTNNVPRDIVYSWELTDAERKDYGYLGDEIDSADFFRYRGEVYHLGEFDMVHNRFYNPNPPDWMKPWDGYLSFGFVGGLVVRYAREDGHIDNEHVVVGWY